MAATDMDAIKKYVDEKDAVARIQAFGPNFVNPAATIAPAAINIMASVGASRFTSADFGRYMMMYINDPDNRQAFFNSVMAYATAKLDEYQDAANEEAKEIGLNTSDVQPMPIITSPLEITTVLNQEFTYQIIAAHMAPPFAANPEYDVDEATLPEGLELNVKTGLIEGTITDAAYVSQSPITVNISATNDAGTATKPLIINVNASA